MALAIVGDSGTREIVVDLSGAGSITLRAANLTTKIMGIKLTGETTIANCTITLRRTSSGGPVIWVQEANTAAVTKFTVFDAFSAPVPIVDGMFLAVAGAWSADSRLIIYTA